jgi:hypothetical protein
MNTAAEPPSRAWMVSIAGKGGKLSAAAISADAKWLALAQEYSSGLSFGVWICALDLQKGPALDKLKLIARFTLPVRHLCWHPSRSVLGVATDDGKLLIWNRETGKRRDFHTGSSGGSVRCLAFDPRGELLATALASGALVVFSIDNGEEKYRGSAWRKNAGADERFLMAWRPDGSALALPGSAAVRIVARGSYATTESLLEGGHRYSVSIVAWSCDGGILATASLEAVALWRPPTHLKVGNVELSRSSSLLKICRVAASPYSLTWGGANKLAIGTASGSWALVAAPVAEAEMASSPPAVTSSQAAEGQDAKLPASSQCEQHPPGQDSASSIPSLNQLAFQPGASSDLKARRRYLAWNQHGVLKSCNSEVSEHEHGRRSAQAGAKGDIGAQLHIGRVEVEYSRLRFQSGMREFKAPDRLLIGALGPGVCALATSSNAHGGQAAKIIVHVASPTKGEKSHFEQELIQGEEVAALAVEAQFVAVLTSDSNLRINTIAGSTLDVMALRGSPVCLATCEDALLCIMKPCPQELESEGALSEGPNNTLEDDLPEGSAKKDDSPMAKLHEFSLEYHLYGISAKRCLATGRLPLAPGATLRWCGFNKDARPLALDTDGVLQALSHSTEPDMCQWFPVAKLDGRGERLWPVHAEGQSLFCAELPKGLNEPRVGAVQRLKAIRFRRLKRDAMQATSDEKNSPQEKSHNIDPQASDNLESSQAQPTMDADNLESSQAQTSMQGTIAEPAPVPEAYTQALKDFEAAARTGDAEEALDIILRYFDDYTSHRASLLEEAHRLAVRLDQEALADRLSLVLRAASGSAPRDTTIDENEEADGEDNAAEHDADTEEIDFDMQPNHQDVQVESATLMSSSPAVAQAQPTENVTASSTTSTDPTIALRIAENRAKALERRAAATAARSGQPAVSAAHDSSGGLDPAIAQRIAENRAKALERKAMVARAAEKRPHCEAALVEAPSALRLRTC